MVFSTLLDRLLKLVELSPRATGGRSIRRCAIAKSPETSLKLQVQGKAKAKAKARSRSRKSWRSDTLRTRKIKRKKYPLRSVATATGTRSRQEARSWPGAGCSDLGCTSQTRRMRKNRRKRSLSTRDPQRRTTHRGLQEAHQILRRRMIPWAASRRRSHKTRQPQSASEDDLRAARTRDRDYAPRRRQDHHSAARRTPSDTGAALRKNGTLSASKASTIGATLGASKKPTMATVLRAAATRVRLTTITAWSTQTSQSRSMSLMGMLAVTAGLLTSSVCLVVVVG
jgi:hypothetical protein